MSQPPTRPAALAPYGPQCAPVAADNGATDSESGHNAASSPQHGTRPTNHTAPGASKLASKPITPAVSPILRTAAVVRPTFQASPDYRERRARHWLDHVRSSESEGLKRNLPRHFAWPYCCYVIRSSNSDKSYLKFAREQVAGDDMEAATRSSMVATTILTLGPVDAVGLTFALLRERMSIREEMEDTVAQTFLGFTVNCARCYDHKFDPIPQEEYYLLNSAFPAVCPPMRWRSALQTP